MKNTPTKLIAPILLLLAGVTAWADPSTPIDPANYPAPVRVACVGDSITRGFGDDPGKSYPSQLQAILGDKWVVKNFGADGRTLLRKGDAPYWNEQAFKDAHAFKPDVVIIMLGTNDTKQQNWAHHDEFYGDYKDLVISFKNLPSQPRIFICRPCPVPEPGNYGISETNVKLEIPLIDKLAAEESVDLIDMHAALAGKPELLPDRVHPNDAGAAVMAQTAAAALTGKTP
ncbi:MAG: GDSL-type esterase/lipase family protein [Methylacidiphilales bacterium]|nr:GDSL-type esterase/lipase family protein [Candidatus Methylacidiphilales bacterium]